ncbi:MAG: oligopeptide transport system substrate-binding protein [Chlamydiales bacterium]
MSRISLRENCFLIISLCIFLTSCGQDQKTGESSSKANELSINLGVDPSTLDPRQARDISTFNVLNMLYEGLMRLDKDGKPVPGVAKKIDISEDGLVYTFHLRESKWSDDTQLTAYDFEYTWKSILNPEFPSEYAHAFYLIKNAQAVAKAEASIDEIGIKAIDDRTLVVELEAPAAFFLQLTALPPFSPISRQHDIQHPDWSKNAEKDLLCNGPFVLSSWEIHDEIVVSKNLNYYDADSVTLDKIHLIMVDEPTELSMFEVGDLDWAGSPISIIPADAIQALKDSGELHITPALGTHFFRFNVEKAPFNNRKMRQAFSYAIDRAAIVEHVLQGGQMPAMGFLPKSIALQDDPYFEDNNQAMAQALFQEGLDEMGITVSELPPIALSYTMNDRHHKLSQAIQQQWKKAFNVDVELDNMEGKVFLDKRRNGEYQIANGSWIGDYSDPINFLEIFQHKTDSVNNTGWESEEFRELLNQAKQESDIAIRNEKMHIAEDLLMDEMPVAPIFFYTYCFLKQKNVKNVHLSDIGHLNFRSAYLEGI